MSRMVPVNLLAMADLTTPWCIRVVATLRIAEHLQAGITRIDELAEKAGCNADSLQRVLRHLVAKGVFEETAKGKFALNEPARGLLASAAHLGIGLDGIGGRMAHVWGSLLSAVRTGAPAYHEVFGHSFWEDLQTNTDLAVSFDAMMGPPGHGNPDPDVLVAGGWDTVRTVVDVGGGTGSLLAEILKARPSILGTLVDRPETVTRAAQTFEAAAVTNRVTTVAQSFFDPLPAGADLYLLKNVLGDWPDAEATILLRRCAEVASSAGRVVVIGGVSPNEGFGPPPDLLMMVLVGGRNRSLAEFTALASAAGLEVRAARRQPTGRYVVECRSND